MPELPEVETIARGLHEGLEGRRIDQVAVYWPGSVDNSEEQKFIDNARQGFFYQYSRRKIFLYEHPLSGGIEKLQ